MFEKIRDQIGELLSQCPDCGGEVIRYHDTYKGDGTGLVRTVCKKKCQGWKILDEYDKFDHIKKKR